MDVSAGRIIKTIPLTSPLSLAAGGMDHFVIVNPVTKTIDRYSFDTMGLEMSAAIDTRQKITAVAMGSRGAGPVILGGPQAQNNASKMSLMFIDLPSLREVEIAKTEGDFNVSFGTAAQLRVSPNGQLLTAWYEKLNPTGLQTVQLSGNSLRGAHLKQSVGTVVPAAEGDAIYTGKGRFGLDLQSPTDAGTLVPAVSGKWFVQLQSDNKGADEQFTKIVIREEGKAEPIASFDAIPGYDGKKDPFQREINQMPTDRRVWLIPEAKVLITVPPTANKLLFFPIGK